MQIPSLSEGMKLKICVNTFEKYEDGKEFGGVTEYLHGNKLKIAPRTVMVLVAE